MSGIVGVWNLDGRPVEEALLSGLSAALAHRGSDGGGLWIQGPVGLACRLFRVSAEASAETRPLVHASGSVLVFDGRLDNREELLASFDPSPGVTADSPDPALILAAYQAFGDAFSERLAGDFALGLFDPARQQLLLARDAIGVKPLYYARTGDTFLFASEIKALLIHPQVSPRPHDDVLARFLLNGVHDVEGRTFFQGVQSLLPAHMATLSRRGFVTRRYWDFDPSRRTRFGSFPEYAEAFRDCFQRAVSRRLRSAYPVAVSVSGGLDSSSIFCLAHTLARARPDRYPAILGVSYTSPAGSPSDEAAFLQEIEREYGVHIERVPMGAVGLLNGSSAAVWHVEAPFLDEQWNTTHVFLSIVRRLGARVLLTGHWGDQMLFDQAYLVDLVRRLAWAEARAHLNEFGRWFTDADPRLFRRFFVRDLVKYHLPEGLIPMLRGLRVRLARPSRDRAWYTAAFRQRTRRSAWRSTLGYGGFATTHARSLYEEIRSSNHVLSMEWNDKVAAMHGLEMAFPFLDRDLLSFLMSIPGEVQTWKGVPKALLREAMRGLLPDAIVRRTWKADFTHLVNQGMERDFTEVVERLQADAVAVRLGYVNRDAMSAELGRLKDGLRGHRDAQIAWALSDLLGLEMWLQVFFEAGSTKSTTPLRV